MEEIWKPVEGYPDYMISNIGRVLSFARYLEGRYLKPTYSPDGYPYVNLGRGLKNRFLVHTLVARSFISKSDPKLIVNHKNGIKADNRVDNLEWTTYSENNKHAYSTKLKKPYRWLGEFAVRAKFSKKDIDDIFKLRHIDNIKVRDISVTYSVAESTIYRILKKQTYSKHIKE